MWLFKPSFPFHWFQVVSLNFIQIWKIMKLKYTMYWDFSPERHYKNIFCLLWIHVFEVILYKTLLNYKFLPKCILKDALSLFDEAEVTFQRKLKIYRMGNTYNFNSLHFLNVNVIFFHPGWRRISVQIWSTHKNHPCFYQLNFFLSIEVFYVNSNYLVLCLETF